MTLLLAVYVAVVCTPLALAWLGARPPRSFADEVASGAGMLAFAVILAEFALSGRFRAVSDGVGMDVTIRLHQLLARTALVFALAHPFLYAAPFDLARPWDATRALTRSMDVDALVSGAVAWAMLPAFVLLAIGHDALRWRYETWRLTHGLGALLISVLVLHHTLHAGRYSADPVIAGVWMAFFALAATSLLHVYVLRPLAQMRRPYSVRSVRRAARATWEVTLEPVGHDGLRYRAGQFVWLNLDRSSFTLCEHPFSIASSPSSGNELRFLIKELGDDTARVGAVAGGACAYLDGPHGALTADDATAQGVALIAGGVGVAPVLSILREMRATADPRPLVVVYGNRTADQIVARAELESLAKEPDVEVVLVLAEPPDGWRGAVGVIDSGLIHCLFGGVRAQSWLFVLCGPPVMLDVVESALIELGAPADRIRSERFRYD